MEQSEREQRKKLANNIISYFGPVNNIYMLSTDDLIKLNIIVKDMQQFEIKALIAARKDIKW